MISVRKIFFAIATLAIAAVSSVESIAFPPSLIQALKESPEIKKKIKEMKANRRRLGQNNGL